MKREIEELSIKDIVLDFHQRQRPFNKNELKELVDSIKKHGLLNPILVRPSKYGKFELVHGEKRFKASKVIRRKTILAEIRNLSDKEKLEIQLIESLRRDDLTPARKIDAYKQLIEKFGYTYEQIETRINENQEDVTDKLVLTKFLPQLQEGKAKEKTATPKTNRLAHNTVPDTTRNESESEGIVWMDPHRLTLSPNNVRKHCHDKEIRMAVLENYGENNTLADKEFWDELSGTRLATLVENVSKKGVIVPIIINQDNQVVAGQRRWLAARKTGKKIPCIKKHYKSPIDEICDSLAENEGRRSVPTTDKHLALKELYDVYGLSLREISQRTGIPKSTIHDILRRNIEQDLLTIPVDYRDVLKGMKKTKQRIAENMIEFVKEPTHEKITRIVDYCSKNPKEVIGWEKKHYGIKKLTEKVLSCPSSDNCPIEVSLSISRHLAEKLLPSLKRKKMNIKTFILSLLTKATEKEG